MPGRATGLFRHRPGLNRRLACCNLLRPVSRDWRGGRVFEGARLEFVYALTRFVGSNPTLSAITSYKIPSYKGFIFHPMSESDQAMDGRERSAPGHPFNLAN